MSCCGRRAIIFQTKSPAARSRIAAPAYVPARRSSVAYFEYTGKTALTVVGPITGVRYRFTEPGSRLAVDLRDRRSLLAVPNLVQVQHL